MPVPIPTVFRCLACGMMWVRPKSWQRTRWTQSVGGLNALRDHCSLGLTELCKGTIAAVVDGEARDAALAAHRIGGDLAVTELAEATMPGWQSLRISIAEIRGKAQWIIDQLAGQVLPPPMSTHPNTILTVYHCFRCWRTIVRPKSWIKTAHGHTYHHSAMAAARAKNPCWDICLAQMVGVTDRDHYIAAFMVGGEDAVWTLCKADARKWLQQAERELRAQAKSDLASQTAGIARVLKGLRSSAAQRSKPRSTGAPRRPPGRRSRQRSR